MLKHCETLKERMKKIVQPNNGIKSYMIEIYKETIDFQKIKEIKCPSYNHFRSHIKNLLLTPDKRCH